MDASTQGNCCWKRSFTFNRHTSCVFDADELDHRERRIVEEANRRATILGTEGAVASLNRLCQKLALSMLADLLISRLQIKDMTRVDAGQFSAVKALGHWGRLTDVGPRLGVRSAFRGYIMSPIWHLLWKAELELDGKDCAIADILKNRLLAAIVEAAPASALGTGGFDARVARVIINKKKGSANELYKSYKVHVDCSPFKSAVRCWITSLFP